jgi:ABC-type Na+ efflux pump permease subunit
MNKTFMIMSGEIRTTLRRKSFVIIAIVVPLLLGVVALVVGMLNRNAMESAFAEIASRPAATSIQTGYVDLGNLIQTVPADVPAGTLWA